MLVVYIKGKVGISILFIANIDPNTAISVMIVGKLIFEASMVYSMYEARLVQEGESAMDYMFHESLPMFEQWSHITESHCLLVGSYMCS
jgi:hypothetical protein